MTERPILFSGPMVRAILAGRKTQTRRALRAPQPLDVLPKEHPPKSGRWIALTQRGETAAGNRGQFIKSRFGVPGDRLWVREAWTADFDWPDSPGEERIRWWHEVPAAFRGLRNVCFTYYRADQSAWHCDEAGAYMPAGKAARLSCDDERIRWRPSIHMPRWVSRLTLEITRVRVERLQAIRPADAVAEGFPPAMRSEASAVERFRDTWGRVQGRKNYSWDANPWVWVLEFRVLPVSAFRIRPGSAAQEISHA